MRVALRDATSNKVGSASQFIEVPDTKNGRLVLSSLALSKAAAEDVASGADAAADASSVLREFSPGTEFSYAFEVLNAQAEPGKGPRVQTQMRLFENGRAILEGTLETLDSSTHALADPKNLMIHGKFQLDPQLAPGDYALEVTVTDTLDKHKRHNEASSWQTFEVVADQHQP